MNKLNKNFVKNDRNQLKPILGCWTKKGKRRSSVNLFNLDWVVFIRQLKIIRIGTNVYDLGNPRTGILRHRVQGNLIFCCVFFWFLISLKEDLKHLFYKNINDN